MTDKSVCIVGPGAIGGMLAVKLKQAGVAVTALARPEKAKAVATRGITLHEDGKTVTETIRAASDPRDLGEHDLVVVTVKSGALLDVAPHLPALSKPGAPWGLILNGVPWWFFSHFGGVLKGRKLDSVDPNGALEKAYPADRIVWGVINCAMVIEDDGSLTHIHSRHIQLGRPDMSVEGLEEIAPIFRAGGYQTDACADIHDKIWTKLMANLVFNPLTAISLATTDLVINDTIGRELAVALTEEARAIAAKLGLSQGSSGAERFPPSRVVGKASTSMLADAKRGRPLEIAPILGAVVEIGELVGVPTPATRMLFGLLRIRNAALAAGF
ncbi:MAG: 2-dehydropantoate 2-reductase [Rhodobacteraceae bacterium]|nr:2-dehydropantoate 2-reductase [Paracoccaceae bacterium]